MRPTSVVLRTLAALLLVQASPVSAQTVFVNGFRIPGNTLDATNEPGANLVSTRISTASIPST